MARGTALVTGASSGIGAALARLCAADGYDLVLAARKLPELESLAGELANAHGVKARAIASDLSNPAAPQALFDAAGPVDILINNAGFGGRGAYAQTDWAMEARMIQVNLVALAHLTKLYLPGMLARRSGRILQVASTAAFVPGPFMAVYYASKAFVHSFSHALAEETKGTGVTVTVLCPGPTRTNFFEAAGMGKTNLFQGPSMTSEEVAREGYRAMMRGDAEVIAGARNRWMIWGTRFAPRSMLRGIARRLNSEV
jgi:hypothetical protein